MEEVSPLPLSPMVNVRFEDSATSASRVFYEPIIGDGGLNLSD